MNKLGIAVLMALSGFSWADDAPKLVLDKVLFQTSAKQWVTTQTALLNVSVNVSLNNADLVKARADLMYRLNKIASGEWHLLQFDRSQDSSGLEKLYVQAQARVNQSALTDVYQHAKSVSVPGANYEITGIEFKPSTEETQAVRAKVREQLYQQVNEEMARINKAYPEQHYTVNHLMFLEGDQFNNQPRPYQTKEITAMASASSVPLTVSNELLLTAFVEAGSNRKQGN